MVFDSTNVNILSKRITKLPNTDISNELFTSELNPSNLSSIEFNEISQSNGNVVYDVSLFTIHGDAPGATSDIFFSIRTIKFKGDISKQAVFSFISQEPPVEFYGIDVKKVDVTNGETTYNIVTIHAEDTT